MLFNGADEFDNFGGRSAEEHSCDIVSKYVHWFSRRSGFKLFFLFIALVAILFNRVELLQYFFFLKIVSIIFLCPLQRRSSKKNPGSL